MGLTMNEILKKHSDCDTFSLTGGVLGYNVIETEFSNAFNKVEKEHKKIIAQNKISYYIRNGKDPLEQIPIELKKHF